MKIQNSHKYQINKQSWNDNRFKIINWKQMKGKRVLDLGCEKGFLAMKAKLEGAKEVVGIEKEPVRIEKAKAEAKRLNLDIDFQVMNIESDEFKEKYDKMFDFVFFCAMTMHMEDPIKMIRWIDKHTKHKLYYETNHHHRTEPHVKFVKKYTSFFRFSDPIATGDVPESYYLIKCCRDGNDYNAISEKAPIEMIPTDKIKPRRLLEKLKIGQQEKVKRLVENIKENGIVVPLIVRKHKDGYAVVEGGHRFYAAQLLGIQLPCKIVSPKWKLKTFK